MISLAIATTACDDDAALKETARSSACDRAANARTRVPTLADEQIPSQLRRLADELDHMAADAATSDVGDLKAAARAAANVGNVLPDPADDPGAFTTKRAELLEALDEVGRLCSSMAGPKVRR
jgi:hypothetical protein